MKDRNMLDELHPVQVRDVLADYQRELSKIPALTDEQALALIPKLVVIAEESARAAWDEMVLGRKLCVLKHEPDFFGFYWTEPEPSREPDIPADLRIDSPNSGWGS